MGPLLAPFYGVFGFAFEAFWHFFGDVSESWFEVVFLRIFWDSFGSRSSFKRASRSIAKTGLGFSVFSVSFSAPFLEASFSVFF